MNTLIKILIIAGAIVCIVPVVFWGIILFFAYLAAIIQDVFGTGDRFSFIILCVLILLRFSVLILKVRIK